MTMVKPFVSLCLCGFFGACAFGRLTPGLTKEGVAVAVSAPSLEEARRSALSSVSGLYVPSYSPSASKISDILRTRAAEFVGRVRVKGGVGVIEIKIDKLARVLDGEGLLRPKGFSSQEPRVLLLVSEPVGILDLGVGPAADALRRGLFSYGLTAIDGRDSLNNFSAQGNSAAELVAAAGRAGADWLLIVAAEANTPLLDPASGAWRASASLVADEYEVPSSTPVGQVRQDASVLDVSSAAARSGALDQAGAEVAARVAGTISRASGGRSQAAVFVTGNADLLHLKVLLSTLRETEGVKGAFLETWRGEEGVVILRVFLVGIKTDGLAARLLGRDPTLTLLSVEPDDGRLSIEIPTGREE